MDTETMSAAVSVTVSLLVILGLLVGLAFVAKRFRGRLGVDKALASMKISVLSTRSLGLQQSLVVAETNGEYFLLGVCKGGITLISRLNSHE